MPYPVEELLAGVRAETMLSDKQIREWFNAHYPDPMAAWQPNIADVIAQISQEIYNNATPKKRLERPQWMR